MHAEAMQSMGTDLQGTIEEVIKVASSPAIS